MKTWSLSALAVSIFCLASCGDDSTQPTSSGEALATPSEQKIPDDISSAAARLSAFINTHGSEVSSAAGDQCAVKQIGGRWFIYCHSNATKTQGALFYENEGKVLTANGAAMSVARIGGPADLTSGALPGFSPFMVIKEFIETS